MIKACSLDPRFKTLPFLNDGVKHAIVSALEVEIAKFNIDLADTNEVSYIPQYSYRDLSQCTNSSKKLCEIILFVDFFYTIFFNDLLQK